MARRLEPSYIEEQEEKPAAEGRKRSGGVRFAMIPSSATTDGPQA